MNVTIYTDGASRNNQVGHLRRAGIGYRICDAAGKVLEEHAQAVGQKTNNEAEYLAIIAALKKASSYTKEEVSLHSDSQLKGEYKIKKGHLLELWEKVKQEEKNFKGVSYVLVPRENAYIVAVDRLVNLALDKEEKD